MAKVTKVLTMEVTFILDDTNGDKMPDDVKETAQKVFKHMLQCDDVVITKEQIYLSDRPAEEPKGVVLE